MDFENFGLKSEWVSLILSLGSKKFQLFFFTAKALNQARLEASVRPYGETSLKSQWPSPFAVVSGVLLTLSFLKYFYSLLEFLAILAVVAGIFPILVKAVASVTRFRLDINALTLIAGKNIKSF